MEDGVLGGIRPSCSVLGRPGVEGAQVRLHLPEGRRVRGEWRVAGQLQSAGLGL